MLMTNTTTSGSVQGKVTSIETSTMSSCNASPRALRNAKLITYDLLLLLLSIEFNSPNNLLMNCW